MAGRYTHYINRPSRAYLLPPRRVHGQRIRSFRAMESSRNVVVAAVLLLQVVVVQSEPFVRGPAAAATAQVRRPIFCWTFFFGFWHVYVFGSNLRDDFFKNRKTATSNAFLAHITPSNYTTLFPRWREPGHLDPAVRVSLIGMLWIAGRLDESSGTAEYPCRSLCFWRHLRRSRPVIIPTFSKQNSTFRISVIIDRYLCWTQFCTINLPNKFMGLSIDKITFMFFFKYFINLKIYFFTMSIKGCNISTSWFYWHVVWQIFIYPFLGSMLGLRLRYDWVRVLVWLL